MHPPLQARKAVNGNVPVERITFTEGAPAAPQFPWVAGYESPCCTFSNSTLRCSPVIHAP